MVAPVFLKYPPITAVLQTVFSIIVLDFLDKSFKSVLLRTGCTQNGCF